MWAAIIAAVGAIVSIILQGSQNKELAEYQSDRNEEYLKQQQDYNLPVNQMERFKQANLNPNLIYGQASSANQSAPLTFPDIKPADIQGGVQSAAESGMRALQAKLLNAQIGAVESKTIESQARKGLLDVQRQIAEANPYLNKAAAAAMSEQWISAAQIKSNEAVLSTQEREFKKGRMVGIDQFGEYRSMEAGVQKMSRELELLDQRFHLGKTDMKIKAAILESKEFQNAVLEVQKRFMTDGDLTPQHFVSFIQLLLMKFALK